MACLPILEYPDPRLRLRSAPVVAFDADLARLVTDLLETLYTTGGIGLSAPQTGQARQVVVMDLSGNASDPRVFVNPEILATAVPGLVEESCLSVPGVVGNLIRATRVRVRAQDRSGESFECELEGMHAVCLQHEMDHLEGKLFVDRLSLLRRLRARAAAARARRAAESARGRQGAA
ncbi:MAG: peptide deformylase [Chromatiaceae bacterium]|jgi:peptide deformylase|nr:peptide deformylase [Chromatiaceae bacterium]